MLQEMALGKIKILVPMIVCHSLDIPMLLPLLHVVLMGRKLGAHHCAQGASGIPTPPLSPMLLIMDTNNLDHRH